MRATGNVDAQHTLSEATNLTTENRGAAIETFTGYLTLVFPCMQKTFKVNSKLSASPSWFDRKCLDKKKARWKALRVKGLSRKESTEKPAVQRT